MLNKKCTIENMEFAIGDCAGRDAFHREFGSLNKNFGIFAEWH
jgi:hypothetical protein